MAKLELAAVAFLATSIAVVGLVSYERPEATSPVSTNLAKPKGAPAPAARTILAAASTQGRIALLHPRALSLSDDGGVTFQHRALPLLELGTEAQVTLDGRRIFVAFGNTLAASTDDGATFVLRTLLEPLGARSLVATDGWLYGTTAKGLWRSDDDGATLRPLELLRYHGAARGTNRLFASGKTVIVQKEHDYLFVSRDAGDSFRMFDPPERLAFVDVALGGGRIYAVAIEGTRTVFARIAIDGFALRLEPIATLPSADDWQQSRLAVAGRNILVAQPQRLGVALRASIDEGESWHDVGVPLAPLAPLAAFPLALASNVGAVLRREAGDEALFGAWTERALVAAPRAPLSD